DQLVHAAAVGAGQQCAGVLVQLQVADLDVGQAGAEALPAAGAAGQPPHGAVGADVHVPLPRVDDQLPDRQVGQVAADVGPAPAGVGGAEHVAAAEDVADGIDGVAGARIDLQVHDAAQAGQGAGLVRPAAALAA